MNDSEHCVTGAGQQQESRTGYAPATREERPDVMTLESTLLDMLAQLAGSM